MKRILSIGLTVSMVLGLCACGTQKTEEVSTESVVESTVEESVEESKAEAAEETPSAEKAYTIITGTIYTANDNDDIVSAVAVKDGKIIYVGDTDTAKRITWMMIQYSMKLPRTAS